MSFKGSEQTTQSNAATHYDPTQTNLVNAYAQATQGAGAPGGALAYHPFTGESLSFGSAAPLDSLTTFAPPKVGAYGYNASTYTPNANVQAGQLSSTDLSGYMNPFTKSVIDASDNDINHQQAIADQGVASDATKAGAFGGDRSAVAQSLTDDSYARAKASTDAGLRSSAYTTALGSAATDIGNRLQASSLNQAAENQAGEFNASSKNAADAFTASQRQAADTSNQQAQLAAAQTRLSALGLNASQAEAIFGANWQQYINSQTDPLAVQQAVTQAYGLIPTGPLSNSSSYGQGVSAAFGK